MFLTIFTPTYNRASTLERVYQSLCEQDFEDMEWIIIDDGSTDETEQVVETFSNAPFNIRYLKIKHGGKHRAYNKALTLANGEYFFTVDSDDWLPEDAIEAIIAASKNIEIVKGIAGVIGLRSDPSGRVYGNGFPFNKSIITLRGLEEAHCNGERAFIIRTDVAKKYPFPEICGEEFVTECVVYDRIGLHWQFFAINKVLTVGEYLPDGLTYSIFKIMWNNPIGFIIYHYQRINNSNSWREAFKHSLRYNSFCNISKHVSIWKEYKGKYETLVAILRPIGFLGKFYYKFSYKWRSHNH